MHIPSLSVNDIQNLPRELEVFRCGWQQIQDIFDLPTVTMEEIIARQIPEGKAYLPDR